MINKCFLSKGKLLGFSSLKLNEDPVREMTICHPPQREEMNPGISQLALDLKISGPMLQGVLFYILFHLFSVCKQPPTHCFYHHLKIQI